MSSEVPGFPVLEIKAFVDASTVVLVGPKASQLKEGDELFVVGIADTNIPGTDLPLVAPKATLVVSFPAGVYVLARTPLKIVTVDLISSFSTVLEKSQRPKLTTDSSQFIGNPGNRPVQVGDAVVPSGNLADYIKWLATIKAQPSTAT